MAGGSAPPPGARVTVARHRVAFYETDAMGIVHHSNFVRYFELARVRWMDEHHRPYLSYVAEGFHFVTTHVAVDYHRPARFDDELEIATWLERARRASLAMAYEIRGEAGRLASGRSVHALVDESGRPRLLPPAERAALTKLVAPQA